MNSKVKYLPLTVFVSWWFFWLIIHNTPLSPINTASIFTQVCFIFMILTVTVSYVFAFLCTKPSVITSNSLNYKYIISAPGKFFYVLLVIFILLLLIYIGKQTSAFILGPLDYFFHIRGKNGLGSHLTNNKYLDIIIGITVYPLIFSLWLLCLILDEKKFKKNMLIILGVVNLLFSYIYQVNYPIILMFLSTLIYILFFKRDYNGKLSKKIKKRAIVYLTVIGAILLIAASLRFGKFHFWGIAQKYLISYHTLGFYFLDYKLNDPNSILHSLSFGRSLLGWFDSTFDLFIRLFDKDAYIAANLENLNDNMKPILAGYYLGDPIYVNAFGTVLFTMYRDFNIVGIFLYSFLYGIILAYSFSRSQRFVWKSVFSILMIAGITSIYQSAVEKPFFWFSIVFVNTFSLLFIKRISIKT